MIWMFLKSLEQSGDGSNSINISTLASIIVSAAGIPVAAMVTEQLQANVVQQTV